MARRLATTVRWPFLRHKGLTEELVSFLRQGGRELWLTGPPGAGSATALRAALQQAPGVLVDLAQGAELPRTLRLALAQTAPPGELQRCVAAVLLRHPQAAGHVASVVEGLTQRLGLPQALPQGTEVQCRELLEHRGEPESLVLGAAQVVARHARALEPKTELNATCLARG